MFAYNGRNFGLKYRRKVGKVMSVIGRKSEKCLRFLSAKTATTFYREIGYGNHESPHYIHYIHRPGPPRAAGPKNKTKRLRFARSLEVFPDPDWRSPRRWKEIKPTLDRVKRTSGHRVRNTGSPKNRDQSHHCPAAARPAEHANVFLSTTPTRGAMTCNSIVALIAVTAQARS